MWGDSTQNAIRLPEEMVALLDRAVAEGKAASRAALVGVALELEMRRQAVENHAAVLRQRGSADEPDTLVTWTASHIDLAD